MKREKIHQGAQVISFTQEIGLLQNIKLQIYKTDFHGLKICQIGNNFYQLSMSPCCNKKQIEQEMCFGECAETKSKRRKRTRTSSRKVMMT